MLDCRECIKFGARRPLVSKTHIAINYFNQFIFECRMDSADGWRTETDNVYNISNRRFKRGCMMWLLP